MKVLAAAISTFIFAQAAQAQVGIPLLTVTDATRCMAALEMADKQVQSPLGMGNLGIDAYLLDHTVAPALDLKFSAEASSNWTAQVKEPAYVYSTYYHKYKSWCRFSMDDNGRGVHYLMGAWITPFKK